MKRDEPIEQPVNMASADPAPTFSRPQLIASKQFSGQEKDVLAVVLEDGKTYTLEQAKQALRDFMNRTVV